MELVAGGRINNRFCFCPLWFQIRGAVQYRIQFLKLLFEFLRWVEGRAGWRRRTTHTVFMLLQSHNNRATHQSLSLINTNDPCLNKRKECVVKRISYLSPVSRDAFHAQAAKEESGVPLVPSQEEATPAEPGRRLTSSCTARRCR
jgi:hypothetical protein